MATRSVLRIINAEWVLIRIVNPNGFRTITEHYERCSGSTYPHINVSNRILVEGKTIEGFSIVCSMKNEMTVNVACIIPLIALGKEDKILIAAVASQIEMLFIIFTSRSSRIHDKNKSKY